MINFDLIKNAVPVKDAAYFYGLDVRPDGKCRCLFHNDKHPSMKLYEKHFHCFGCNAHGDVIDLVCALFGINISEAAAKLVKDFDLSCKNLKPSVSENSKDDWISRYTKGRIYQKLEKHYLRVFEEYLSLLREWKVKFRPSSPDERYDDRFIEAVQMEDHIEYLVDVLLSDDAKAKEYLIKNSAKEVEALEEKIKTHKPKAFWNC